MAGPYFDSASGVIDESKKNLLNAVAMAGTAGKQAFDAAQAQAAQAKQDAMARAAQRSALYGVGGNDQTYLGAYDARVNQGNVNRANFDSGLAQTQASGESYLEKARAAIPVLQAVNTNKAADTESKIKLAITAAQQKAAADAAAAAQKRQDEIDRENRADQRAIMRENRADARAAAKQSNKLPSANDLLGTAMALADQGPAGVEGTRAQIQAGVPITDDMLMTAQDQAAYAGNGDKRYSTDPMVNLAKMVGTATGLSPAQVNSILTPSVINSYVKATAAAPSSQDAIVKSIASKYATKGVTPELVRSALNGQDFQTFVNWIDSGAGGLTQDEAKQKIADFFLKGIGRSGGNPGPWNAEYQILVGEYLPNLPKG